MYLSKLTLDLRSKEARRDLGDAYEMHRTLARAYVANEQSAPARFLWRLELGGGFQFAPVVLVQSSIPANWHFLELLKNYARQPVDSKYVVLETMIQDGRCFRFRLLANPTVTRQGKRLGLVGVGDQLAWLERQAEQHGFANESAGVVASDLLTRDKDSRRLYVQRVCFEGVLRVTQADRLRNALRSGIGPAKAFGCGLLSVAPV
jgi:CRISPR system Cascade subunit CasE